MWTKEKVNSFVSSYGFKPVLTKSEVKHLPNILHDDEDLLGIIEGELKIGKTSNGYGVLIATDKRVIFFRKSILGTQTKEEYPISRITSSIYRKGLMYGAIAIVTANNEAVIDHCSKSEAKRLDDIIQKSINQSSSVQASPSKTYSPDIDKIERLFEMKEKGILTEEEFQAQKNIILKNIK